jgi:hypothetical protein
VSGLTDPGLRSVFVTDSRNTCADNLDGSKMLDPPDKQEGHGRGASDDAICLQRAADAAE